MARFAAIDVGTNALRLRMVEATRSSRTKREQLTLLPGERDPGWKQIASLRAAVRLGGEVFLSGRIAPSSIGQACAALKEFRREMDAAKVDAYRATATSAVREAANGATLVERARREAGIELDVIEGVEEARLIQLAVTRKVALEERRVLLIDVGGGSTELTILDRGQSTFAVSLPIGTVRLLEAYLRDAPTVDAGRGRLVDEAIDRALAETRRELKKQPFDLLLGTGGNLEMLAELCPARLDAKKSEAPKSEGQKNDGKSEKDGPKSEKDKSGEKSSERGVDVAAARDLSQKLRGMTAEQRAKTYNLRPDRADTLVPATAIFLRIADLLGASQIVSPGVGLKDGILEELVDKHFEVWDSEREAESVAAACLRLGRRYHFDEGHGVLVAHLAMQLFDGLKESHDLGGRDRLILRAAALLHDVGDFVRYDGHHKHSFYVILHSDIMGLSPEERGLVANVARYHRKSPPDTSHPNFRELDKIGRAKVRALSAILRIADALDREHLGKVKSVDVSADRHKGRVTLHIEGEAERALEEWTVRAKAGLFKDVFGLDVVLTGA